MTWPATLPTPAGISSCVSAGAHVPMVDDDGNDLLPDPRGTLVIGGTERAFGVQACSRCGLVYWNEILT